MSRVVRTPLADLDVFEIAVYIARENVAASDRFLATLEQKLATLARSPLIGRQRDELAPGMRSLSFGSYVIFYRPLTDGIEVVRVLHSSRDIPAVFGKKQKRPTRP